jgi:hypothetical protein
MTTEQIAKRCAEECELFLAGNESLHCVVHDHPDVVERSIRWMAEHGAKDCERMLWEAS